MKKLILGILLVTGLMAVAFASFSNKKKKTNIEQKIEKKDCSRKCVFS